MKVTELKDEMGGSCHIRVLKTIQGCEHCPMGGSWESKGVQRLAKDIHFSAVASTHRSAQEGLSWDPMES